MHPFGGNFPAKLALVKGDRGVGLVVYGYVPRNHGVSVDAGSFVAARGGIHILNYRLGLQLLQAPSRKHLALMQIPTVPSFRIPAASAGQRFDHWEQIALALAWTNGRFIKQSYDELAAKLSRISKEESQMVELTNSLCNSPPPQKKSGPFLGGAVASGITAAVAALWAVQAGAGEAAVLALLPAAGAVALGVVCSRRKKDWNNAVNDRNAQIESSKNSLGLKSQEKSSLLRDVPQLLSRRIAKLAPRFAWLTVDRESFLLNIDVPNSEKGRKKQILQMPRELNEAMTAADQAILECEQGLPVLLNLDEKDDPEDYDNPWGEERRLAETAADLAEVLERTSLRPINFQEADSAFLALICEGQSHAVNTGDVPLDGQSVLTARQAEDLEPVFSAAEASRALRELKGCSLREHLEKLADRVEENYLRFDSFREEAINEVLRDQVGKIMGVFPRKNAVFLNSESNPVVPELPPHQSPEAVDWNLVEKLLPETSRDKIRSIVAKTTHLQNLARQMCGILDSDPTEARVTIKEEAQKALEAQLATRTARIRELLDSADTEQSESERANRLSARLHLMHEAGDDEEMHEFHEAYAHGLPEKLSAIRRSAFWECSLTKARFESALDDEISRMAKIKYALVREMRNTFWARRRESKIRIMSEKEEELRRNLNQEAQELRDEAKTFTTELRSFREMINEEIRSTEKSKAGCSRLVGELGELQVLSSSELSRITSMLDSGDSDRFFKTADE